MRTASQLANSQDQNDVRSGFEMIALIASKFNGGQITELGFIDNALFLARKHASSENSGVRQAVVSSLVHIGHINKNWLEAALETADEIDSQPSEAAKSVAGEVKALLSGEK
jgi:hypothetical protein